MKSATASNLEACKNHKYIFYHTNKQTTQRQRAPSIEIAKSHELAKGHATTASPKTIIVNIGTVLDRTFTKTYALQKQAVQLEWRTKPFCPRLQNKST